MKPKQYVMTVLSIIVVLSLYTIAGAEIHEMYFNVWTTNYPNPADQQINFYITISDTNLRAPDAVTQLEVNAPDGTKFFLTEDHWQEFGGYYWYSAYAADFDSGIIPSGKYRARVIDKSGKKIKGYDRVHADFLDPPVITSPTDGATVSKLTPKITWSKVSGAIRYRILMQYGDHTWRGDPIYWYDYHGIMVYRNSFPIPKGVLKPGRSFLIRIEARDADKDMEKRSRSDWIQFFTP